MVSKCIRIALWLDNRGAARWASFKAARARPGFHRLSRVPDLSRLSPIPKGEGGRATNHADPLTFEEVREHFAGTRARGPCAGLWRRMLCMAAFQEVIEEEGRARRSRRSRARSLCVRQSS